MIPPLAIAWLAGPEHDIAGDAADFATRRVVSSRASPHKGVVVDETQRRAARAQRYGSGSSKHRHAPTTSAATPAKPACISQPPTDRWRGSAAARPPPFPASRRPAAHAAMMRSESVTVQSFPPERAHATPRQSRPAGRPDGARHRPRRRSQLSHPPTAAPRRCLARSARLGQRLRATASISADGSMPHAAAPVASCSAPT